MYAKRDNTSSLSQRPRCLLGEYRRIDSASPTSPLNRADQPASLNNAMFSGISILSCDTCSSRSNRSSGYVRLAHFSISDKTTLCRFHPPSNNLDRWDRLVAKPLSAPTKTQDNSSWGQYWYKPGAVKVALHRNRVSVEQPFLRVACAGEVGLDLDDKDPEHRPRADI